MTITKSEFIWMDGKFVKWDEARIHVLTHALHYGTGVFEGIRCYQTVRGSAVFRLKEHIDRLYDSARIIRMEIPYTKEEFAEAAKETVRKNNFKACYIRPLVFRGYGQIGVNPLGSPVNCVIAVWPWEAYLGKEGLDAGIKVMTSSFARHHVNSMPTKAKITGAYANAALAKMEAVEAGYMEAIMLDHNGLVCEGSGENIFVVKNKVLTTIPLYASVLAGITRDSVIHIAKNNNFEFKEEMLSRDELYLADEIFFTGTAAEITPVVEVDRRQIGEGKAGPITKRLQGKFFDAVSGKDNRYDDWLDFL